MGFGVSNGFKLALLGIFETPKPIAHLARFA
jgi:hypothetical protein